MAFHAQEVYSVAAESAVSVLLVVGAAQECGDSWPLVALVEFVQPRAGSRPAALYYRAACSVAFHAQQVCQVVLPVLLVAAAVAAAMRRVAQADQQASEL